MKKKYSIPFAEAIHCDFCDILTSSDTATEIATETATNAVGQKGGSNGDCYGDDCFPK